MPIDLGDILDRDEELKKRVEAFQNTDFRESVYLLIDAERAKQKEKEKPEHHPWATWFIIFADYVGRVSKALWSLTFNGGTHDDVLVPLVKAVSIGVAWLEDIIRYAEYMEISEELSEVETEEEDGEEAESQGS
jgi:hypothetical protein